MVDESHQQYVSHLPLSATPFWHHQKRIPYTPPGSWATKKFTAGWTKFPASNMVHVPVYRLVIFLVGGSWTLQVYGLWSVDRLAPGTTCLGRILFLLAAHAYTGSSPLKEAEIIDSDFAFSWDKIIFKILLLDSARRKHAGSACGFNHCFDIHC